MHAELAAVPDFTLQRHSRQPGDCKRYLHRGGESQDCFESLVGFRPSTSLWLANVDSVLLRLTESQDCIESLVGYRPSTSLWHANVDSVLNELQSTIPDGASLAWLNALNETEYADASRSRCRE